MTTFAAGYGVTKRRADEKKLSVLRWLYQFNVSTTKILTSLLGVGDAGQYPFFARLKSENLIKAFNNPVLGREQLFQLTDYGRKMAAIHLGSRLVAKRNFSQNTLLHDLTVQLAVTRRLEGLTDYVSERNNGAALNGKVPDVLLHYGEGNSVALEMELTHKNNNRIYHGYLAHLRNVRDQHYQHVIYLFTAQNLLDLYQSKFNESQWPVFDQGPGGRLIPKAVQFDVRPETRRFFSFQLIEGYYI